MTEQDEQAGLVALPGDTGREALLRIARGCCVAFDEHLSRLFETDDPDGPHKARVALRRLRTALWAFEPILKPGFARKTGRRARELFRVIGTLRDADVLAEHQAGQRGGRAAAAHAERIRAEVRARLRQQEALRFGPKLLRRLAGESWQGGNRRAGALRNRPVTVMAARALGDAWAACLAHGGDLGAMAETERHDLRKDLKTMRYMAEFFGPLWPGHAQAAFLNRMKGLQDALGDLNDLALLRAEGAGGASAAESLDLAQRLWTELSSGGLWWPDAEVSAGTDMAIRTDAGIDEGARNDAPARKGRRTAPVES